MRVIVLPNQLSLSLVNISDWASSFNEPKSGLAKVEALFAEFIPANTEIFIEENDCRVGCRYLLRLRYTSARSGRTMCTTAKADTLPEEPGTLLDFYLRQLVLSPSEIAREFSRVYFLERRAKQEAFLYGGDSGKENIRVSGKTVIKGAVDGADNEDRLTYLEYA